MEHEFVQSLAMLNRCQDSNERRRLRLAGRTESPGSAPAGHGGGSPGQQIVAVGPPGSDDPSPPLATDIDLALEGSPYSLWGR